MRVLRKQTFSSSIQPSNHPNLSGAWTPNDTEYDAVLGAADVLFGAVPSDIAGTYLRNTENPLHNSLGGRYHPFDGDGMLHAVTFLGGGAVRYRNRFVRTKGFEAERAAGAPHSRGSRRTRGLRWSRGGAGTGPGRRAP